MGGYLYQKFPQACPNTAVLSHDGLRISRSVEEGLVNIVVCNYLTAIYDLSFVVIEDGINRHFIRAHMGR